MSSSSKLSLKLLIHKGRRKVLFGEADKKFIDFLFTILALPVATIVNLVSTETKTIIGPLRNLHHSVQNMNPNHFQENYHKNIDLLLLKPKVQIPRSHISSISQILPIESSLPLGYYKCATPSCCYYATATGVRCPGCATTSTKKSMQFVPSSSKDDLMREWMMLENSIGFVKDMTSYLVMDDLTVKPMSAMSSISMLADLGVDDLNLVQEKLVYLDTEKGLDLLRASICCSSTVLNDVFLHNIHFEDSNSIVEEQKFVVSTSKNLSYFLKEPVDEFEDWLSEFENF